MTETKRLIAALRHYAQSGRRIDFPFDNLPAVLKMAADELEARLAERDDQISK